MTRWVEHVKANKESEKQSKNASTNIQQIMGGEETIISHDIHQGEAY